MRKPSPWNRLKRLPLALEIALALLFKIALLWLVWKFCFSTPQTKKMLLPTPQVEQHLLGQATASVAYTSSSSSKDFHDSDR